MSRILKLEVEGSKFFTDPLKLELSKKLNCIMGGRGTGKTTLLWLLASGLDPLIENNKEVFGLLNSNLGQGKIKLSLQNIDGEVFEVEKVLGENPIVYRADRTLIDFDSFRESISVDFYKSSQIEDIGMNPEDRLALIDKHLSKTIKDCRKEESVIISQLNQNKSSLSSLLLQRKELLQKLEPLEDVEKELKEYEKLKPQGSEEEAKQFEIQNENQKNREFEKQFYTDAVNNVRSLLFKLQTFKSDIEASIVQLGSFETPLNKEILGSFKGLLNPTFTEIEGEVNKLTKKLSEASDLAKKQIGELESVHRDQETNFTQLKQRFEKNREYFQRLNQLTKRVTAKTVSKKELDVVAEKLTSAVDQRKELLTSLKGVYRRIYETRLGKVIDINLELDGDVKIILKEGGIVKEYERALKEALKGKGFNYNEICSKIVTSLAPVDFSTYVLKEDSKSLSVLLGIGIDKAKVIIDSLLATQDIFALETIYCPDLPTFFLKVDRKDDAENQDKDNYRQTENLSTGQRCTAILPIIFAASSNPLVIDQPEDNLDNKYIADTIHKIIKRKKDFRQLIFVTHNPNIPVLSDAEFNVFLDYKGKKTKVDKSGTIDEVKINILTLLEGGEDAFKKRSEIYGY